MRRRLIDCLLLVILLATILVIWQGRQWQHFINKPMLSGEQAVDFVIEPGTPLIKLAWDLKRQHLIDDPHRFMLLAKFFSATKKIKAGEYRILPGITTPKIFINQIKSGKVNFHSITFIEGWTFNQLMQALNNNPLIKHTLTHLNTAAIMAKLGSDYTYPEGLFYPDTYSFSRGDTDLTILQKAYQNMQRRLNQAWQLKAPNLPYKTPYQALIIASLIEKETALPQERPLVAGVILRRLNKNMLLQIDASVIYGLGSAYTGKLTRADLTVATPYNTYLNTGLPPTPIAMPSISSINAALHPAMGDALYYVATGEGGHTFSTTFSAHEEAAKRYWRLQKERQQQKIVSGPLSFSANELLVKLFPSSSSLCISRLSNLFEENSCLILLKQTTKNN